VDALDEVLRSVQKQLDNDDAKALRARQKSGIRVASCDSLAVWNPDNPIPPISMIVNGRFSHH
jgi:hypothetical protein